MAIRNKNWRPLTRLSDDEILLFKVVLFKRIKKEKLIMTTIGIFDSEALADFNKRIISFEIIK